MDFSNVKQEIKAGSQKVKGKAQKKLGEYEAKNADTLKGKAKGWVKQGQGEWNKAMGSAKKQANENESGE